MFCTEKTIFEECVMVATSSTDGDNAEENLVCCCTHNCDSVGMQLQDFNIDLQKMMFDNRANETETIE